MPLYTSTNSNNRKKQIESAILKKYSVPINPHIEKTTDLFDLPLPEYNAYNYESVVLRIFEEDGPELYYETIKYSLQQLKVPTHCGMVFCAIYALEESGKIIKVKKHLWRLIT